MKKSIVYTGLLFVSVLLASCDKFLTPAPTDRYSESTAFASEDNAKLYVNSFYPILGYYGLYGSAYLGGNMYVDGMTDIIKTAGSVIGSNGASANLYAYTPSLITSDQNALDIWSNAYYYIRLINEFLQGLDNSSLAAEAKEEIGAEARFFRGYLYFLLMRNHGSVILQKEPSTVLLPRSSAADCWNFVEEELNFAASHLPASRAAADAGRITSGAAYAMLSRAMLYAERWQSAYNAADAVFALKDNGVYALGSYANAFNSYRSGNKESILEFNYSYPQLVHSYDAIASPGGDDPAYEFGGDVQPTQELVEMYEKAGGGTVDWSAWHTDNAGATPPWADLEPRFQATVLYTGATWKGRSIQPYAGGTDGFVTYPSAGGSNRGASVTGYYLRKNLDENHTDLVNIGSAQTWVEIRLAEVYLNAAEAAHHLGNTANAQSAMNVVRSRVGLPALALTGDALLTQIKKERTLELAGENQHYWDLRRWKDAVATIANSQVHGIRTNDLGGSFSYDYIVCDNAVRQFPAKLYAFPILSSELVNNPNITQIENW